MGDGDDTIPRIVLLLKNKIHLCQPEGRGGCGETNGVLLQVSPQLKMSTNSDHVLHPVFAIATPVSTVEVNCWRGSYVTEPPQIAGHACRDTHKNCRY